LLIPSEVVRAQNGGLSQNAQDIVAR